MSIKIKELEMKFENHDEKIYEIISTLNEILTPPKSPQKQIGFQIKEPNVKYRTKIKRK